MAKHIDAIAVLFIVLAMLAFGNIQRVRAAAPADTASFRTFAQSARANQCPFAAFAARFR